VASVLAHMIGGRQPLVTEILAIVRGIQRLTCGDPMRVVEEQSLLEVLLRERRRSRVPLGDGAFALLAAPGGPLAPPPQRGPTRPPRDPRRRPSPTSSSDPQPGPSAAQGGPGRPESPQPGPSGTQGGLTANPGPAPGPSGARGAGPGVGCDYIKVTSSDSVTQRQ